MDQQKIGNFIAGMQKEKGLTQLQLADRLRVSVKTVSSPAGRLAGICPTTPYWNL